MTFPYTLEVWGMVIHPHFVFELLAYTLGFQLYRQRARLHPELQTRSLYERLLLLTGCIIGAALTARGLAWLETPYLLTTQGELEWIPPGKTIVGGLLGGWIGIEIAKKYLQLKSSTGDQMVFSLGIGIAIGRIGCFLTGLADHTYGIVTSLPWGVDFGDGVLRHPTQLYEIIWLLLTLAVLSLFRSADWVAGLRFRLFMGSYLFFRFGVEFIKPTLKIYGGLSMIQIACLLGLSYCIYSSFQLVNLKEMAHAR